MKKTTDFRDYEGQGWPDQKWLAPYFLTPAGRQRAFGMGNDSWAVTAEGVDGTEGLPPGKQIDNVLYIFGKLDLGVMLFYDRWSATDGMAYYSKGNLNMLRKWVVTKHGTRMPVGLFISFEQALKALIEFIETDGALPRCIEWVAAAHLPDDAFPEPEVRLRDS